MHALVCRDPAIDAENGSADEGGLQRYAPLIGEVAAAVKLDAASAVERLKGLQERMRRIDVV